MRDYSIVSGRFWIGETGKLLRKDHDAQLLALYLVTSPHSSMTGLYYCPLMYVSQDTGLSLEAVKEAMDRLCDIGFCVYDEDSETVFVLEMARFQIAEVLAVKDNRRVAVIRELDKISSPFVTLFIDKYGAAFNLDVSIYPSVPHWRVSNSTINALTKRDGRTCRMCSTTEDIAVDHVIARINGGTNELSNLQFLCTSCNSKKSAEDRMTFWENVEGQTLRKGAGTPLTKGSGHPLPSQDQDQDHRQEQDQKKEEVGRPTPPSSPAVLDLGADPITDPPKDATPRLRTIYAAMQGEVFLVPGKGEQTLWENAKRPVQLAKKLDESCPAVDVATLIMKLAGWTVANPKRAKRDLARFVWNAAVKDQDKPKTGADETYRHGTDLASKVRGTRRGGGR